MHHIVSDGWSVGVFTREMSTLYQAFSTGKPSPLPELPIQYADFAVWQREWLQGEVLDTQLSYWKQQLEGAPPVLELPTDYPRPAIETFRGGKISTEIPKSLTEALKAMSRREGATLFMTLMAGFQTLLYRYTGQEDVVVGSPIANRNRTEIEGLIGFFVNELVLRADLSGNPSFRELLSRVREAALGAYAHQDLPFEKLVKELQPQRDISRNPLFQVALVNQNAPSERLDLPGLKVTPVEVDTDTAKFDLSLYLWEEADGLKGRWEYGADLFDAATIVRMAGHYNNLLEAVVRDPDQRLSELPILSAQESHQMLVEWNDTEVEYPTDRCIHELFEDQVQRNTYIAPRSKTEETIVSIWEQTLGENRVGVYDDFFGLGGNSLLAVEVITSVREAFHIEMPISALFDAPTVSQFGEHVDNLIWLLGESENVASYSSD